MICVEYALCYQKYKDALDIYKSIMEEQEQLFNMTQPKSVRYDKDRVQSTPPNLYEQYISKKEEKRIDERLNSAKELVNHREYLLEIKKKELIASKNVSDLIYRYKNIDNISPSHISEMMGYSMNHIYRILENINSKIEKML